MPKISWWLPNYNKSCECFISLQQSIWLAFLQLLSGRLPIPPINEYSSWSLPWMNIHTDPPRNVHQCIMSTAPGPQATIIVQMFPQTGNAACFGKHDPTFLLSLFLLQRPLYNCRYTAWFILIWLWSICFVINCVWITAFASKHLRAWIVLNCMT